MRLRYNIHPHELKRRLTVKNCLIINFFWLLVALIIPNIVLGFTEHLPPLCFAANILLPLGLYWVANSSSTRPIFPTLALFPFMFLAAFQLVLLSLYGKGIIAVDMFLNVVTTNYTEATELLSSLPWAIALIIVLYIPPIVTAVIASIKKYKLRVGFIHNNFIVGWLIVLIGAGLFGTSFLTNQRIAFYNDIFPLNVCYNLAVAVRRDIHVKRYAENPPIYKFFPVKSRPDSIPELYVLVIGETSRADNWEMFGYKRPTNPRLRDRSGIVGFGRAMSESNTTYKSVPMLLTHLNSDNYADSLRHVRSIISAFKEAGYTTSMISNQEHNGSFIDFFAKEADSCLFIKDLPKKIRKTSYDGELIPYIKRDIASGGKKHLLVVHTYGSHFKYNDRYPDSMAVFRPHEPLDANYQLRPELINAYDNTIVYTSKLLDSIAGIMKGSGRVAAMIYTSDHGEDIYDDEERRFLHASPTPTYWQLHVPLLIWFSPQYISHYPEKVAAARANSGKQVSSTSSFFPTAMDISGITTFAADSTKSLTDKGYTPGKAMYLTDREEAVGIEKYGIKLPK